VTGPIPRSWATAAACIAGALGFAALALALPAETFFVGDPGVKLIAATRADPDRPLEIPLPRIGTAAVPYVEPFFAVHGDHAHPVTSELFPLLTRPLVERFGLRGAYLLPALGFFLSLAATAKLAAMLGSRPAPLAVAGVAILATPWLFYGLEFWEHMPAVGVAGLATVWLLGSTGDAAGDRPSRAFIAGGLYGLSILLRPEAAWFVVAVVLASRILPAPPRVTGIATATLGMSIVLLPLSLYSVFHFGTLIPPHVGSHASLLTREWLATRAAIGQQWFVPRALRPEQFWGLALVVVLISAFWRAQSRRDPRLFLALVGVIDIVLVVLTAPNDGGGQWGPRYLLPAFVPAAVLTADLVVTLARTRVAGAAVVAAAVVVGILVQREGYQDLRGAKRTYGRVLDFVRREVPEDHVAVTDVWWLDQVAAAAAIRRQFLYASSPEVGREIVDRLASAGAPRVTVIGSEEMSPAPLAWLEPPCYRQEGRREIPDRKLIAVQLRRACP
jgi:hypothetical protein